MRREISTRTFLQPQESGHSLDGRSFIFPSKSPFTQLDGLLISKLLKHLQSVIYYQNEEMFNVEASFAVRLREERTCQGEAFFEREMPPCGLQPFRQTHRFELKLSPDHLVDDADVGLDDLDDLCGDVLIGVVRNRDSVLAVTAELHGGIDCLEK